MGAARRRWLVLAVACLVLAATGSGRDAFAVFTSSKAAGGMTLGTAASFRLTQPAGTAGCVSDSGTSGACVDVTAPMATPGWVTVSPDNKHVYVATRSVAQSIVVFTRDQSTGALSQVSCISRTGNGGVCATEPLFSDPFAVALDPTGSHLYMTDRAANIVFAYARDSSTGALTALSGTNKCVSETGNAGACATGRALQEPNAPVFTTDGAYLYVPSRTSNAVAAFSRNTSTGVLSQLSSASGCISSSYAGCTAGRVMAGIASLAVSPDNTFLYATAIGDSAIDVLARDTSTGALSQPAGTAGCVSDTGSSGNCVQGVQLTYAGGVVVSPDGAQVYATAWAAGGTVLAFSRNPATGAISQLTGTAGCINLAGAPCAAARIVSYANYLSISPDGQNVYVPSASGSTTTDGIAVFRRDPTSGALRQDSGTAGCWQENANSGCSDAVALVYPVQVTVAPDGKDLYSVAYTSGSVAVFNRSR